MTNGKKLAISALMGVLGASAAFAAAQHEAKASPGTRDNSMASEKHGCGKDGGSCKAHDKPVQTR